MLSQLTLKQSQQFNLLSNFIEYLKDKNANQCQKLVQKMNPSMAKHAQKCVQLIYSIGQLQVQDNTNLNTISQIQKQKNKLNAEIKKLRINESKLAQKLKQANEAFDILDLLKKGMYIEANKLESNSCFFIQQLIQYKSLKNMNISLPQSENKLEEDINSGQEYRHLKERLFGNVKLCQNMQKEVKQYTTKMDAISDQQLWPQPRYINESLFGCLKSIHSKLRYVEKDDRLKKKISSQNPFEYKSSYQQLQTHIGKIYGYLMESSSQRVGNINTFYCLKQIQGYIKQTLKAQREKDNKGERIQSEIMIMSLQQRVKDQQKNRKNIQKKLNQWTKSLKQNFESFKIQDENSILDNFQIAISIAMSQITQKRELNSTNSFKIGINKTNIVIRQQQSDKTLSQSQNQSKFMYLNAKNQCIFDKNCEQIYEEANLLLREQLERKKRFLAHVFQAFLMKRSRLQKNCQKITNLDLNTVQIILAEIKTQFSSYKDESQMCAEYSSYYDEYDIDWL